MELGFWASDDGPSGAPCPAAGLHKVGEASVLR